MRPPNEKFTVAIAGSGRLLGMFATELMAKYPKAVVYDRSDQFKAALKQEIELGKSKFAAPEFRKLALTAERNFGSPARVDVTVTFMQFGQVERVGFATSGGGRSTSFDFGAAKEWSELERFVQLIVRMAATPY